MGQPKTLSMKLSKDAIRRRIWAMMEVKNLVSSPRPCYGRIPNFVGSETAAERISDLDEFRAARCVFCAPDAVLRRVREIVLETGKTLTVALPHIRGFVEITEQERIKEAISIRGFSQFGKPIRTRIDLFVQGCVAVDLHGNRLGKGSGYGDREWDILVSQQIMSADVPVIVFAHTKQIVEDMSALREAHDKPAHFILSEAGIVRTTQRQTSRVGKLP